LYDRIAKKIYANPDLFPEENLERGFDLISMKGASVHYNKVFKEMSYFLSGYPHEVSDLAAPTMVVWGDSDRLIPTKQMKLWKRDNPNLEYRTIENCGHIPHGERPQKSAKLLLSFFDTL
jgi:pimeloyl-ACP methyl ester carboxylesterase